MSSSYIIYKGRDAVDAAVLRLHEQQLNQIVIARRLDVTCDYVRSVLARYGKLVLARGASSRFELLRDLIQAGTPTEEIQKQTGYSANTIYKYRGWINPGKRYPHHALEKGAIRKSEQTLERGSTHWPCFALSRESWKKCHHTRNCQCWLNGRCEVDDGTR